MTQGYMAWKHMLFVILSIVVVVASMKVVDSEAFPHVATMASVHDAKVVLHAMSLFDARPWNLPGSVSDDSQHTRLCDSTVKQHSGYIDIPGGKHLFFWFFEARASPDKAPVTVWINGGPGCSSTTGLLRELGPCNIARDGNGTTWNPYSWTNVSNMIFIDQPVGTGFSYSDFGNTTYPSTSEAIAADIFDFMLGWYAKFPKYANLPLHLAGESWAGHMLPYSAVLIQKHNQELRTQGRGQKVIPLESVMLGNALTSAFYQLGSVPQYLCQGPYALPLTALECQDLEAKADKCKELIKICYDTDEEFDCAGAHEVCWASGDLAAPIMATDLNPYNLGVKCNPEENGVDCYAEIAWTDKFLNSTKTKKALGVDPALPFRQCEPFYGRMTEARGQWMRNSARHLIPLIDGGIRVLVYNGNADFVVNYMGSDEYLTALNTSLHQDFIKKPTTEWKVPGSSVASGYVRTAGTAKTLGNQTFVALYRAGHYAPYDQPKAALHMFTRWIKNKPLS